MASSQSPQVQCSEYRKESLKISVVRQGVLVRASSLHRTHSLSEYAGNKITEPSLAPALQLCTPPTLYIPRRRETHDQQLHLSISRTTSEAVLRVLACRFVFQFRLRVDYTLKVRKPYTFIFPTRLPPARSP